MNETTKGAKAPFLLRRFAILIFCTLVCTWQYVMVVLTPCTDCNEFLLRIVQGQVQSPFSYRLLTPYIIIAMGNTPQALAIFHLVMFAVFFCLLWKWAASWHVDPLLPMALATAAMPIMLQTYWQAAYAITEWDLWVLGLLLLFANGVVKGAKAPFLLPQTWRLIVYAVLIILGGLNREMTSILLWLSFFAGYPRRWQWWCFYGLILCIVFFGLRFIVPTESSPYNAGYQWNALRPAWRLHGTILYNSLLLPLWVFLYSHVQGSAKRLALIVLIPYFILFAVFAVWQETRLLMPLFILGVPFMPKVQHA